jgi:stage V sporulation protein SpoVS
MATTSGTRIDDDLFDSARLFGAVLSRSASQQITHWARIGRELETAASTSPRAIAEVLSGEGTYDSLTSEEQAVVRAGWAEAVEQRVASLDLAREFAAEGRSYVELDKAGHVVRQPR